MCQRTCQTRIRFIDTFKIATEEGGINLPKEVYEQGSEETIRAFALFRPWFRSEQKRTSEEDGLVIRANMPEEIREAFELIKKSPIPGYEGVLFEDSRYVRLVEKLLV